MLGRPATRIELNLENDLNEYKEAKEARIKKHQQEQQIAHFNNLQNRAHQHAGVFQHPTGMVQGIPTDMLEPDFTGEELPG